MKTSEALPLSVRCIRSYDPFDDGRPNQFGVRRQPSDALFTSGRDYPCRSQCDGWNAVSDNNGVIHTLPNAAFLAYFKFL
jgi:hypothetical protein